MTPASPELSVILPCRNQADHIGPVLGRYLAALDPTRVAYELVVVPNACTDETAGNVRERAEREPRIRVVENPEGGWGLSVLTGMRAARGRTLCFTNSARTDPAHIPPLLELFQRNSPCIAKVRRHRRGVLSREAGSSLYNLEARALFGIAVRDVNGTPKVLLRGDFERLALESPGDLLDLEIMAKAHRLGIQVVEMPVEGFTRHGGRSSTNLRSAWRMYAGAVGLRRTLRRFGQER